MSKPELSIMVAAFNEENTIEKTLRRICAVYPKDIDIMVIDGGTDDTKGQVEKVAKEFPCVRYVRNENDRGKGHATRTGMENAKADVVAQIDADLQFMPEDLPKLVAPVLEGKVDVTLGTRFTKGSTRLEGSTPFFRTLGNRFASGYASFLFLHSMTDVQAGMKCWKLSACGPEDLKSDNYSYEVEIPIRALQKKLKVIDVPITTDARQGGETCVNVVTDGIPLLVDITRFRLGLR